MKSIATHGKTYVFAIILIMLSSFCFMLYAEERTPLSPVEAEKKIISDIRINGLWRTRPSVVYRELLLKKGEPFTLFNLTESVQRLKNLRIFSIVTVALFSSAPGKVSVIMELEEKWTILPYARIGSGGGTTFFIAGIYDINIFGTYTELGVQQFF